jgi:hypothetical protein
MSSNPLSLIFEDDGSLMTKDKSWSISEAHAADFNRTFGQYPPTFLKIENRLRTRCEENGVTYVPPKITDSVAATFERIKKLNRAIKSAKQKLSRNAMPEKDRKELSAKRSADRMEKISRESVGDKKKRLKREANWKQKQRDRQFEAQCKRNNVPCPPPRKENDTAATIRAERKMSRDAIKGQQCPCCHNSTSEGECRCCRHCRSKPELKHQLGKCISPFAEKCDSGGCVASKATTSDEKSFSKKTARALWEDDDPKRYEKSFSKKGLSWRGRWQKQCKHRSMLPGKTHGKRCSNFAKQGGYCYGHGGWGRTLCGHDDCNNIAQKGGMCRRHGANLEKCKYDFGYTHSQKRCKFYATKGGMCDVHSRPKCSQEGCERDALKTFGGVCWKHLPKW